MPRSTTIRLMPRWRSDGIGLDGGDDEVGVDAVGDERLGAVDDVVLAVTAGAGGHRGEVRADTRLGHRERRDQLAGGDPGQPALALLLGAVAEEVGQADVVVQGDAEADAADARALGLFADDEVQPEVLGPGAAVALRHGHPEEAAVAGAREHLAGDDARALPLAVAAVLTDDLALQERAKARAEVFVEVLEQVASHPLRTLSAAGRGGEPASECELSQKECEAGASNKSADEACGHKGSRARAGERHERAPEPLQVHPGPLR